MPRLCLHLSGAVIFSVTAGACYCHCLQPAPALWFPRTTPDTAPPTLLPHPHSHSLPTPAGCPYKVGALRQGRGEIRVPTERIHPAVSSQEPAAGHSIALWPRPVLQASGDLSRRRSGFLQRPSSLRGRKESGVQKQSALAPRKRGGKRARGQIETTEERPWCTVCP